MSRRPIRIDPRLRLIIALCLIVALVVLWYLDHRKQEEEAALQTSGSVEGTLSVHFIDVGQADSVLVVNGEDTMLIDGGNVGDSSLVVSYLEGLGINQLDYVVCTHAHEDHVGGLSGPLNTCQVGTVYAPVTEYNTKAFSNFVKYTEAQGAQVTIPSVDETFNLGGAVVTVLGPRMDYDETNNTSIVLRLDYGETSFLFTGDMERNAEADLIEAGCPLDVTVLKVGHHGSETSSSYPFLREVMPQYAVISVGEGNTYGHPSRDTISRLEDLGAEIYRTDAQGTVVATTDGTQVTFAVEYDPPREIAAEETLIGNVNSHVYHRDGCPSLPSEKNRVYFTGEAEAKTQGYTPCGSCIP